MTPRRPKDKDASARPTPSPTSSKKKGAVKRLPAVSALSAKTPEVLPSEDLPEEPHVEPSEEEDEREIENEIQSTLPAHAPARPEVEDPALGDVEAEDSGPSAARDPIRRYLAEVRRYPLLTPEQEFALAMKLKNEGDMNAARAMVSANLRLVVKIAMEYRNYYSNLLDLVQEGNIGLMKAVSKYDPDKGVRLGYYASWWIRSYILKYLLDNFRLVKIGTTQAQKKLFYHLMREKGRLEAQGLLAGPKLLAEKLNVREKDVVEMEQRLSGRGAEMSLDAPLTSGDEESSPTSHLDMLTTGDEGADDRLAHQELLDLLRERLPEFLKILNDKERSILKDRLLAEEPKTLQEVADRYGLTRERARQIEAKVIQKLKEFLAPDL